MQLFKHMEIVLMLAFGIVCVAAALPPAEARRTIAPPTVPEKAEAGARGVMPMPVVQVVGRRPTPAEKRANWHVIN